MPRACGARVQREVAYLRQAFRDAQVPLLAGTFLTLSSPLGICQREPDGAASPHFLPSIPFVSRHHSAPLSSCRRVLEDANENPMVRHEAAEALGSIAAPECITLLKQVGAGGSISEPMNQ